MATGIPLTAISEPDILLSVLKRLPFVRACPLPAYCYGTNLEQKQHTLVLDHRVFSATILTKFSYINRIDRSIATRLCKITACMLPRAIDQMRRDLLVECLL